MTMTTIVPLYAAVLALLFVALSVRTLRMRRRLRIAVGDAGDKAMLRAMRVHANFAEYVPLTLLLLHFAESAGSRPLIVHLQCAALLLGRWSHAYGVSQIQENLRFRVFGMAMTFVALISGALSLLFLQLVGRIG